MKKTATTGGGAAVPRRHAAGRVVAGFAFGAGAAANGRAGGLWPPEIRSANLFGETTVDGRAQARPEAFGFLGSFVNQSEIFTKYLKIISQIV